MSSLFFLYENDQNKKDENRKEAVGWEENISPFNISILMTPSHYKMSQKSMPDRVIHQLDMPMKALAENVADKE